MEKRTVNGVELKIGPGVNLSKVNLSGANLSNANLTWTDLSGADLSGAYLSETNLSGADLTGADLSRSDLSGAYLYDANLSNANLSNANLSGANLYGANLYGANLSGANLSMADLSMANLTGANLSWANLSGADLSGADLTGADLRSAHLDKTSFSNVIFDGHTKFPGHQLNVLKYQPGIISAFKFVRRDYRSFYFPDNYPGEYKIGHTYVFPDADTDPLKSCAAGLNVATPSWIKQNLFVPQTEFRFLEIQFTAGDIACIPYASDGKFRLHRGTVARELQPEELGL